MVYTKQPNVRKTTVEVGGMEYKIETFRRNGSNKYSFDVSREGERGGFSVFNQYETRGVAIDSAIELIKDNQKLEKRLGLSENKVEVVPTDLRYPTQENNRIRRKIEKTKIIR